ncbi:MAG: hypothetical protein DCC67_03920 [Planctomycetota bacterium]|nr:MAG: hypothetical protein DCC67_03920 [Planctomycetota bacterium]
MTQLAGQTLFLVVDIHGRVVASDERWESCLGVAASKAAATLDELLLPPADDSAPATSCHGYLRQRLAQCAEASFATELATARPPGEPIHVAARRLAGPGGPLVLVAVSSTGSAPTASRDPLTGLADRRELLATVESWRRCSPETPFALLFIDLDEFKQVNDQHGHLTGDQALEEVARRWQRCVREEDVVARYGGDEFIVLVRGAASVAAARPVVRRLRRALETPIQAGDAALRLSATIGTAIAASPLTPFRELLAAADKRMYAIKRRRPR